MFRKCFKFNTCFVELLKNSTSHRNFDPKWTNEHPFRLHHSCCVLDANVSPPSTPHTNKAFLLPRTFIDPPDRGDSEQQATEVEELALAGTPANTELFEIKGPNDSAFLVEVHSKDLDAVRKDLVRLKGDFFRFEKTIPDWFAMKCILAVEPFSGFEKDQLRLAKVHAITSGCEEVYVVDDMGKLFFVNSVDNTVKTKKILEKLGYKVCGILYRFQPRAKIVLEDRYRDVCQQFLGAVEQLPKVLSVTHNL